MNDINIKIIPADKGRAIVVMETNDYHKKVTDLLADKETYLKIIDKRRNPCLKTEKDLNKLLQNIRKSPCEQDQTKKQIQDKLYNQLHSTDGTPARFYGMPKVHKVNVPLRPITSCISFPAYELSKHLVTIISPLLNNK